MPQAFPDVRAHTVNAYRRFAPGSWAPKTVSWAHYNYAAAVRTAAETEAATRLEDCGCQAATSMSIWRWR